MIAPNSSRGTPHFLAGVIGALLPLVWGGRDALAQATPATPEVTVAPPTYTDSQATRGEAWFASACQECHPSSDFSGADFKLRWTGRPALDLFKRISTTMPEAAPGSLSRRTYTDIVSYLMRLNGLPAGTVPLATDSLGLASVRLAFPEPPPTPSP